MSKAKKIIIILSSVIALIAVAIITYGFWMLSKINHKTINKSSSALGISTSYDTNSKSKYDDIVNIALFGIDARGNEAARSDTIMILSVNRKENTVKVISLLRDSYVKIEGHGSTKLTHAYFYGGAPLAIKTINQNFNMNIKDYVTVNFDSCAKVIDAVGGVTIKISEAERLNANHNIQEYAKAWHVTPTYIKKSGEQVLNGMQAVGYARIRYVGNADYERTERQRRVMEQLFDKALKMSPLQYPKMLSTILPLVETSLTSSDILDIGSSVMKSGSAKFEQMRFPLNKDLVTNGTINGVTIKDGLINGVNYVFSDLNVTSQELYDYIFNDIDPTKPSTTSTSSGTNK